jgi:nucleotide-binding universal stress UspA family protein
MTVKTILVPIDFSEQSARVLEYARLLADACGASMHVLHIIAYPLSTPETADDECRDAHRRLDALLTEADWEKRHATTSCEVGAPVHEIVKYATDHATDLIVMGTHWHGPTFMMAAGSIAEGVLGLAPCAVLAVKGADAGRYEFEIEPGRTRATT